MGFNQNTKNGQSQSNNDRDASKAVGFINIWLPTKDGGKRKVGAIPLRGNKDNEVSLAEYLGTGTEEEQAAKLANFVGKIKIDFQSSTPTEGSAFDL